MDSKPVLTRSRIGMTIIAAALSILISFGLLTAVAELFLQESTPLHFASR